MAYNEKTQLWESYIYIITNIINGKQYVGQTRTNVKLRLSQHFTAAKSGKNYLISKAIRKYGKKAFIIETIETITANTLKELKNKTNIREKYYISVFNTFKGVGYNATSGGEGNDGGVRTNCVSVDKYDLYGNLISTYNSLSDAARSVNTLGITQIRLCCEGLGNTSHGFVWRYKNHPFDEFSIDSKQLVPINCFDKYGTLLNTYNSLTEASIDLNISLCAINSCCSGRIHICSDKYVFRYIGDSFDKYVVNVTQKKKVNVYNYKKEIIMSFDSIMETAEYFKTTPITISEGCRGENYTLFGYVFRFDGDSFDKYPVKFRQCWLFDSNKNFIREFKNQSEASRETGISLTRIQKCFTGKLDNADGYYFKPIGCYP